ncbi:hypothetical protein [Virgisporangium aurantiacum]|uniref:Protein kinase domain-containing protein n=1 Tax=Virgisporangium aurantiacum TaxID=175570 RepID=A0A8J3ZLL5_9ACTN|nr:hypothetical protein [Virgisporangium aurantiacum]GIJ63650.1 hypothetical protein Vau01_111660 [Virgisporangium aurantiacum]
MALHDLRVETAAPAYAGGGECAGLYRLTDYPGLLFKLYNGQSERDAEAHRIDRLVAQPDRLTDPCDRALAMESIAWPVSRVVDGDRTIGVLLPEAPSDLKVPIRYRGSRTRSVRFERLDVDLLAKPNSYLVRRGIGRQTPADRYVICHRLAQIAYLFARLGIVYADWSYSNAFWHPVDHRVFLIDVDTCSYGPRRHVETSGFEDPLTPLGLDVDTYLDRYRAALLISRCLTGERDVDVVRWALAMMPGPVPDILTRMLIAPNREQRPSLTALAQCFDRAGVVTPDPGQGRVNQTPGGTGNAGGSRDVGAIRGTGGTGAGVGSGVAGWRPRAANSLRTGGPPRHARAGIARNTPAHLPLARQGRDATRPPALPPTQEPGPVADIGRGVLVMCILAAVTLVAIVVFVAIR